MFTASEEKKKKNHCSGNKKQKNPNKVQWNTRSEKNNHAPMFASQLIGQIQPN